MYNLNKAFNSSHKKELPDRNAEKTFFIYNYD